MRLQAKIALPSDLTRRLAEFLTRSSSQFGPGDLSKSSYWRYHSDKLVTEIDQTNQINLRGESGFYVPPPASFATKLLSQVLNGVRQPSLISHALRARVSARFGVPRLMSYHEAFDAVMRHDAVSDPDLSPWRVNHVELASKPGVFRDFASVAKHYQSWSSYAATPSVVSHYYYQNLLRGHIPAKELGTVLEIGAGNGNFPSILYHDWSPVRVILIDLPETIALAFTFLANLFPEATLCLPNEVESGLPDRFDFAFLTTDQLALVASSTVDLAINCHSFQEMTHQQIAIYFAFIQRVCRESGYLFTANRIEKIPGGPDSHTHAYSDPPNRFAEYPWNPRNEVLIYEVSRLMRLVQLDGVAIRLERIRK